MRICSFSPSATEMVLALGLDDQLVGVTDQCHAAKDKDRVARSFIPSEANSRKVDALVRQHRTRWGTIFDVDEPLLERLKPDLILTQTVCEVCAVPAEVVDDAASRITKRAHVLPMRADTVADIAQNIRALGAHTGRSEAAKHLVETMKDRIRRVQELVQSRPRRRVYCLEWLDPVRSAGHWIPQLAGMAGGEVGHWGGPGNWDEIRLWNPDVIIMMPCAWDIPRIRQEWETLQAKQGDWKLIRAFAQGGVWIANGQLCSRYGPGVSDTLETFAAILHPDVMGAPIRHCAVPLEVQR